MKYQGLKPAKALAAACGQLERRYGTSRPNDVSDAEWIRISRWAMHVEPKNHGLGCGLSELIAAGILPPPVEPGPHRAGPDALSGAHLYVELAQMKALLERPALMGAGGLGDALDMEPKPLISAKGRLSQYLNKVWVLSTRQACNWAMLEVKSHGNARPNEAESVKRELSRFDVDARKALNAQSEADLRRWGVTVFSAVEDEKTGTVWSSPDACPGVRSPFVKLSTPKLQHDFLVAELGLCLWEVGCEVIFERDSRMRDGLEEEEEHDGHGGAKEPDLVVRSPVDCWHVVELARAARYDSEGTRKCKALLSRTALRVPDAGKEKAPWLDYLGVVWVKVLPNKGSEATSTTKRRDKGDAEPRSMWNAFGELELPGEVSDTLNRGCPVRC